MLVHTGDKPCMYSVCQKSFSRKDHLSSHKYVHGKRRPRHCRYYGMRFKSLKPTSQVSCSESCMSCSCKCRSDRFTSLHCFTNSRHICGCHTTNVLVCYVTFARGSSAVRDISFGMKMWSHMFAVCAQTVSVQLQQLNWRIINWCTWTTNSFAVIYVVNGSNVNMKLSHISDVMIRCNLTMTFLPGHEADRNVVYFNGI